MSEQINVECENIQEWLNNKWNKIPYDFSSSTKRNKCYTNIKDKFLNQ